MKIKILYEDFNILVIDKPSGISVHGDGRSKPARNASSIADAGGEKTVADWVLKNYPKMKNVGEAEAGVLRPGVVHRLDRETSGVLILAKNQKAHAFLKQQFQDREVKKIYHAIVAGHLKNDRGVINKPIGRSPKDFRRRLAGRGARGELKEAVTEYKVIKRFEITTPKPLLNKEGRNSSRPAKGEWPKAEGVIKFSYLEIKPKTGRTHQIRVHMKYLNHPVVCDSLYNPDGPCPKPLKRLALHAKSIEFKDLKGNLVKVESKIPKEFTEIV